MAWLQKFFLGLMPRRMAEAAAADTAKWRVRCLTCGYWRDLLSLGGLRYKAASRGKRTLCRCPQCGNKLRWSAVERIPPELLSNESPETKPSGPGQSGSPGGE